MAPPQITREITIGLTNQPIALPRLELGDFLHQLKEQYQNIDQETVSMIDGYYEILRQLLSDSEFNPAANFLNVISGRVNGGSTLPISEIITTSYLTVINRLLERNDTDIQLNVETYDPTDNTIDISHNDLEKTLDISLLLLGAMDNAVSIPGIAKFHLFSDREVPDDSVITIYNKINGLIYLRLRGSEPSDANQLTAVIENRGNLKRLNKAEQVEAIKSLFTIVRGLHGEKIDSEELNYHFGVVALYDEDMASSLYEKHKNLFDIKNSDYTNYDGNFLYLDTQKTAALMKGYHRYAQEHVINERTRIVVNHLISNSPSPYSAQMRLLRAMKGTTDDNRLSAIYDYILSEIEIPQSLRNSARDILRGLIRNNNNNLENVNSRTLLTVVRLDRNVSSGTHAEGTRESRAADFLTRNLPIISADTDKERFLGLWTINVAEAKESLSHLAYLSEDIKIVHRHIPEPKINGLQQSLVNALDNNASRDEINRIAGKLMTTRLTNALNEDRALATAVSNLFRLVKSKGGLVAVVRGFPRDLVNGVPVVKGEIDFDTVVVIPTAGDRDNFANAYMDTLTNRNLPNPFNVDFYTSKEGYPGDMIGIKVSRTSEGEVEQADIDIVLITPDNIKPDNIKDVEIWVPKAMGYNTNVDKVGIAANYVRGYSEHHHNRYLCILKYDKDTKQFTLTPYAGEDQTSRKVIKKELSIADLDDIRATTVVRFYFYFFLKEKAFSIADPDSLEAIAKYAKEHPNEDALNPFLNEDLWYSRSEHYAKMVKIFGKDDTYKVLQKLEEDKLLWTLFPGVRNLPPNIVKFLSSKPGMFQVLDYVGRHHGDGNRIFIEYRDALEKHLNDNPFGVNLAQNSVGIYRNIGEQDSQLSTEEKLKNTLRSAHAELFYDNKHHFTLGRDMNYRELLKSVDKMGDNYRQIMESNSGSSNFPYTAQSMAHELREQLKGFGGSKENIFGVTSQLIEAASSEPGIAQYLDRIVKTEFALLNAYTDLSANKGAVDKLVHRYTFAAGDLLNDINEENIDALSKVLERIAQAL